MDSTLIDENTSRKKTPTVKKNKNYSNAKAIVESIVNDKKETFELGNIDIKPEYKKALESIDDNDFKSKLFNIMFEKIDLVNVAMEYKKNANK